jgi:predicted nucleic acid-binding protein
MVVLDTDTLTHLLRGHARVEERRRREEDDVAITSVTRIEVLQGRFASVLKAEDGEKTRLAQERLEETERDLEAFEVLPFDAAAAAELDRLLKVKGLKKIGRCDLLIAAIALARKATLATCNVKHHSLVPGLKIENWAE